MTDPTPATGRLVPVSVIGGYLGAGKTTLINRLLAGRHGRRLAVLVNDFGAVNIDAALVASHDGETISLTNGCVCCSIADALGQGLDRVLAVDPGPDQIIIETSGVADPAKVAAYGRGWPGCRLDAVMVLADAETIEDRMSDRFVGELVERQLRGADLIVLTKCDLLSRAERRSTADRLRVVSGKPVIESGRVPESADPIPDLLLGSVDRAALEGASAPTGLIDGDSDSPPGPDGDRIFETAVLDPIGPIDRGRLEAALDGWADTIVRIKGLALVSDHRGDAGRLLLVNRVGARWELEPAGQAGVDLAGATALVVIAISGTLDVAGLTAELVGDR